MALLVDVESVKIMPTLNCLIAFSPEAPLLVTGSTPDSGSPTLSILRASPGLKAPGLKGRALIDVAVAEFVEPPAAFCRLCWSKPLETGGASCPAGLIAGGLESGEVAVWDPRKALSTMECLDPDEKDFTDYLQQRDTISTETEYDFCELWKPQESLPTPPLLHGKTGNIAAAESGGLDLQEPVARFSKHLGSVCGLGFSSHWPNLIGSGAENGRIIVWDLANPYAETVPTWETECIDGDAITCITWSPMLPRVLGSTSFQGVCFWDIKSSKSPINSVGLFPRKLSSLAFNPVDENSVVVSCEDYLDTPSIAVWDLRWMKEPVSEQCENSKGVITMSWSPYHDDALLVSTKNNKIMLWSLAKQEAIWKYTNCCRYRDVQWSPSNKGLFAAASYNNLQLFKMKDRASSPV